MYSISLYVKLTSLNTSLAGQTFAQKREGMCCAINIVAQNYNNSSYAPRNRVQARGMHAHDVL